MKTPILALGSLVFALALPGCAPEITSGGAPGANVVSPGGDGPGTCGDVELHVVGLYDPYSSDTNTLGPANVHIDRPGSVVLFLSAYTQTDWTVTAGPNTDLVAVYAHGYGPQTVSAPAGVATTAFSFETDGQFLGCGYEYPDKDPTSGCETPELLAAVSQYTQLPVSSFHGCYAAADFQINADLSSSSNCATGMGYVHTSLVTNACTSPTGPNNACAGKAGTGHYEGFFCEPDLYPNGGPFIITEDISCEDALANCALNAASNPELSIECTWEGDSIFLSEQQAGACQP